MAGRGPPGKGVVPPPRRLPYGPREELGASSPFPAFFVAADEAPKEASSCSPPAPRLLGMSSGREGETADVTSRIPSVSVREEAGQSI